MITTYGPLEHKLQTASRAYAMDETEVVAEGGPASIYERLNVYASGYVLRLTECLAADFQVLRKFMSEDVFFRFAKAYLLYQPSTSFTLYDLGAGFANFLEQTKPNMPGVDAEMQASLNLPPAIARLDRMRQESLRAHGLEKLPPAESISLETLLWQPVVIQQPPCLRLLISDFDLQAFYEDLLHNDQTSLWPKAKTTHMAISRNNYRLTMLTLEPWQYHFMQAATNPVNVMQAVKEASAASGVAVSTILAELYVWLPVFQQKGMIMRAS